MLEYFTLGAVATLGMIATALLRPEAMEGLVQFVVTIMAVASTGAVTFYMLGKQSDKVEQIQSQTNGNLSRAMDDNEALRTQLQEALIKLPPEE